MFSIIILIFILYLKQSISTKTVPIELNLSFSELNEFISTFDSCHVHIFNYKYIDIASNVSPISITRVKLKKYLSSGRIKYQKSLYSTNRSLHSFIQYINANFRWSCNLHVFLLPNQDDVNSLTEFPTLHNYWHALFHPSGMAKRIFKEARMDYCFLVTQSTAPKFHADWALQLEFAFTIQAGGYIHRAVILVSEIKQKMGRNLKISKFMFVCPFCTYGGFTFLESSYPKFTSKKDIFTELDNILKIRHPENSMDLTDMRYNGELFKDQKFISYNLRSYKFSENTDLIILGILYPNGTYMRVYLPTRNVNIKGITRGLPWITVNSFDPELLRIQKHAFSFVTCDGFKGLPKPTFLLFVSAFHYSTWFSLLVFALILVIFLKGIFTLKNIKQNASLVPFMAFLEQGVGGESTKIASFSWLIGTWMLVCVILSNAYKGQNITDLTAPRKPLLFEKFSELVKENFTFYSKRHRIYQLDKQEYIYYPDPKRTAFREGLYIYIMEKFPLESGQKILLSNPKHVWNTPRFEEIRREINGVLNRTISVLWKEGHPDALFEAVLTCNRSAIIDEVPKIEKYERSLRRLLPGKYIAMSKQPVLESASGWIIRCSKDPFLNTHIEWLMQSGIIVMWQKYNQFLRLLKSDFISEHYNSIGANSSESSSDIATLNSQVKPLSLVGNMVVVFYLFSFVIMCGIITYFVEVSYGKFQMRRRERKFRNSMLGSNPSNNKFIPVVRQFLM